MTQKDHPAHILFLMNHGKLKFIGKPCRRNPTHVGLRYIGGYDCVECGIYDTWDVDAAQKFDWVAEGIMLDLFAADFNDLVIHPPAFTDARRNRSSARVAYKSKQPYFQGSACGACGCTLRFALTAGCVACQRLKIATTDTDGQIRFQNPSQAHELVKGEFLPILTMHMDRLARKTAITLGLSRYVGSSCKQCGGTARYTTRGQCIACVKERNDKKKTAPARTGAANFNHLFE